LICTRSEIGEITSGINANCYWDGLEIKTLWVADELRNQGIGEKLVLRAEEFARENGAVIAWLKTLDARKFYERLGYHVYGELEDRPIGTVFYHMKKRLDK
jgi:ribosomal protein S18 acetylase RimI-like enzyme